MKFSAFLAAAYVAVALAGCGPGRSPLGETVPADPPALRRVLLPDVTGMTPALQDAIRRAHAAIVSPPPSRSVGELAGAYGALGNLFLSIGYFGSAAVCYDNARTLAPLESRWSYYLGHVYRHVGELDRSAGAFNRALQMDPDYVPARLWLGEVALAGGRAGLARLAFEAALSSQPQLQAALAGLGRVALEQRDYRTAAEYLGRALAVDANASAIRYPLALAYRGLGDIAAAEAHLAARGPQEPAFPDPWLDEIARVRRRLAD